jgi:MoxR-like ATPase
MSEKLWLPKHRETFHFRGKLKRLGLRFDGEKRLWCAPDQAALEAAVKLLNSEAEKVGRLTTDLAGKAGEAETTEGSGEGMGRVEGSEQGSEQGDDAAESEQGEGNGDGQSGGQCDGGGGGGGNGPGPFTVFADNMHKAGTTLAAAIADQALQQMVKQQQQGKQQQEKERKQQQQEQQKLRQEMQQEIAKAKDELVALSQEREPKKVEITINDEKPLQFEGEFVPDILEQVIAMLKIDKAVRLVGPAGSGKSKLGRLAADVLGLRFGFINGSEGVDESHLYGFRDITNDGTKYVVPELCFADLYEHGGLWLGDEFDRMNPNVTVSLNGSLSEPWMLSLPKRTGKTMAHKHPDFRCAVTMNTWGTGPNAAYTSANRLDASSLDRFRFSTIYVDYNRKLEAHLMPDADLLRKIWKVRDKVMALGLQRVVSTRFIKDAWDGVSRLNWSHEAVLAQLVLDWSETDKQKVA